ncbi:MAG: hypothetical protein J6X32_04445 [Salinivirgaceae bacterium]|nr:hypothetical protein [Salinivirgaceae bacterium]
MKNKTLLTLCAAPLLLSVNAMADGGGAVTIAGDLSPTVNINEDYDGAYAFTGWGEGESFQVYAATYTRVFTANKPATIVLPFNMPSSISTNADFYTLQYVIPDFRNGNRTWLAKMQKIATSAVQAHKPYAVIVPNGGQITFNFSGTITVSAPYSWYLDYIKTVNVNYNGERDDIDVDYPVANNAGDWYFIGNYSNGTYSSGDDEVGLCYGFEGSNDGDVPKGSFGKIANGTVKKAFRGLLCKKDNTVQLPAASFIKQNGAAKSANMFSIPETINVEFVDTDANGVEHTTYVGKLNRIDNVRLNRERSTFDLKGRNVDGKRTAKGVYLKK